MRWRWNCAADDAVLSRKEAVSSPFYTRKEPAVEPANRRLIRPSFNEAKNDAKNNRPPARHDGPKRSSPPEQTNAENFYYLKQMQSKTQMTFVLKDGEVLKGVIEWYDKDCLKVNREGDPNLLLFKSNIKYMYKA
jgi:sRNA-binding regulator protein Hfq